MLETKLNYLNLSQGLRVKRRRKI